LRIYLVPKRMIYQAQIKQPPINVDIVGQSRISAHRARSN